MQAGQAGEVVAPIGGPCTAQMPAQGSGVHINQTAVSALCPLPPSCHPTHFAGHNCLAAELVVTDRSWPLRDSFMAALRLKLSALPNRIAYYPGQ